MNAKKQSHANRAFAREKLIFAYNADSGLFNSLVDAAHKILSPQSYPCALCQMTYGHLGMRKRWRHYLQNLTIGFEFLYRDAFYAEFGHAHELPLVGVRQRDGVLKVLIGAAAFNELQDVETLIERLDRALET